MDTMNDKNGDATISETMARRELFRRAGLLGAVGLVIGPATIDLALATPAEAQFGKPSVDQQKQLGRQAAQQILQKYREVHDKRAVVFDQIGQRLVAALPDDDRKKWDFNYHVLDSKEINAFALPGGPMFLFTGLMERVTSEDALAAVTGHEMTHVRKEHWAKAYAKSNERNAVVGIGAAILGIGRTGQTLAGIASNVIGMKYSRGEEDEADAGGLENLLSAGFSPDGMLDLFATLQKLAGNGNSFAGALLSDHPLTSDRIKRTAERIEKIQQSRSQPFPKETPLNYRSLLG